MPPYLHDFPWSVILHCLERKSNSRKFNVEDILTQDQQNGIFTIKGSSENIYTVNFGESSEEPFCTCFDWTKWNIPCKHFFAIFSFILNWIWDCLPSSYRSSVYLLSTDSALQNLPSTTNLLPSGSIAVTKFCNDVEATEENLIMTDMPHKMVCDLLIKYISLISLVRIYSHHQLPHSGIVSGRFS